LPRAVTEALGGRAERFAVQPAWRSAADLLGRLDPVTKYYRETRLLQALYEALYRAAPCSGVLEHLTAAPPGEYLPQLWPAALLRGQSPARALRLAEESWPGDPRLLQNGALPYPDNLWLIGTVGQAALPAAMADAAAHFSVCGSWLEETARPALREGLPQALDISSEQLRALFQQARTDFAAPDSVRQVWEQVQSRLAARFNLSAGAFAERHMEPFASVCLACGMKPAAALDAYLFHIGLRRLEYADPAALQYEGAELARLLEELFGKHSASPLRLRAI
jgi:hypothetical protein